MRKKKGDIRERTNPFMAAAFVIRLASFLLWLSSYRSVSSRISSEIISSMTSVYVYECDV
jgi:hypothetical protein